ncbi:MAG TPA: sigma-54 dependent transcriptional regulator, partial [Pirellulales bacterium]
MNAKLLVVEDDAQQRESTIVWLASHGYRVDGAGSVEAALRAIGRKTFDLVLCDLRLPDGEGFRVAEHCRRLPAPVPVVLVTGAATVQTGVQALRCGAADLIVKPYLDSELENAVERVLRSERAVAENARLREELDRRSKIEDVVGDDPRMRKIFDLVERVASSRTTVLLTGESGTGKSLIARAIHRHGQRSNGPFVEVACGALPESLLESELFGHAVGSFTGASAARVGRFQQADKGTIFLDEIGTASPALQVKLLRVLQEMEFEQVGGTNTIRVDSRVVLATNEDLAQRVAEGTFRQDLFYRINVVAIELP